MSPALASALRFVVFSAAAAALAAVGTALPALGLDNSVAVVLGFVVAAALKYVEARKRLA